MTLEVVSAGEASSTFLAWESVRFQATLVSEVMRFEVVSSLRDKGTLGAGETGKIGVVRAFNPSYNHWTRARLLKSGKLYRGGGTWPLCDEGRVGVEGMLGH